MIRQAEEKDYIQLANMKWQRCIDDYEDYGAKKPDDADKAAFISRFTQFLKSDKTHTPFVMEEIGVIVSAMLGALIPKAPTPDCDTDYIAYLSNVYTLKEHRGKGKGAELLSEIKKYLEARRCELMIVWPSKNATDWYKRNGFTADNSILECDL